jgi:hypothetical protein
MLRRPIEKFNFWIDDQNRLLVGGFGHGLHKESRLSQIGTQKPLGSTQNVRE